MDIRFEVETLESTEGVDSAQAATATLCEDWLDITLANVNFQKNMPNLFEGKTGKRDRVRAEEALKKYYNQGEPRRSDHQIGLIHICQI